MRVLIHFQLSFTFSQELLSALFKLLFCRTRETTEYIYWFPSLFLRNILQNLCEFKGRWYWNRLCLCDDAKRDRDKLMRLHISFKALVLKMWFVYICGVLLWLWLYWTHDNCFCGWVYFENSCEIVANLNGISQMSSAHCTETKLEERLPYLIAERVSIRVLPVIFFFLFNWINSLLHSNDNMWYDGAKRPLLSSVRFLLVYILKCKWTRNFFEDMKENDRMFLW